eukprot:COSAG01_NODE_19843_length_986_cov_0.935738_1_plen_328_part_11
MSVAKGSGDTDLSKLQAKFDETKASEQKLRNDNDDANKTIQELEDWKADALVEQAAAQKQLDDAMDSLAKEISNIKDEQANAESVKEVTLTKLSDCEAKLDAAVTEKKAESEARLKAVEELKISNADSDAKSAKIEALSADLAASRKSEEDALAAKKGARDLASQLNDECGLLRSQLTTSNRSMEKGAAQLKDTGDRLAKMEALNIENNKTMDSQNADFVASQNANKELKDALNKLMDVVSQSEAAAKTATDAIKSGKAAAPVLSTMRQEAQELNKAVQQAAKSFDPAAGQFNAGDVKAAVQRGTLGNASAAAPKPAAKKATGAVAKT